MPYTEDLIRRFGLAILQTMYPIQLLLSPLWWLATNLVLYYILYLTTVLLYRCYKFLWCARSLLPVAPNDAIFITGATSGIGLQLAKHFYKLGYSILVGYYDDKEPGYFELKTLSSNKSAPQKILFIPINVRDAGNIERAFQLIENALRENKLQLYGLINNAGLGAFTPFMMCNKRELSNIIETNIHGAMMTTRILLPLLLERPGSRILNVASGLGIFPGPTYVSYGVTKAAQIYFTRGLNAELNKWYCEHEVKCVTVLPHNYIKHTNIGTGFLKKHQELWSEHLTAKERNLYKRDYEYHRKRLEELCESCEQFRKRKQARPTNDETLGEKLHEILEVFKGKNSSNGLDDPDFLQAFNLALRLPSPPEEIFAGDRLFNLVTGPIILTLPTCCLSWFGWFVNGSLYK